MSKNTKKSRHRGQKRKRKKAISKHVKKREPKTKPVQKSRLHQLMNVLPNDCLFEVFQYLNVRELALSRLVSNEWINIIDTRIWRFLHRQNCCKVLKNAKKEFKKTDVTSYLIFDENTKSFIDHQRHRYNHEIKTIGKRGTRLMSIDAENSEFAYNPKNGLTIEAWIKFLHPESRLSTNQNVHKITRKGNVYSYPVISNHTYASGWEMRVSRNYCGIMVTLKNIGHIDIVGKVDLKFGEWYNVVCVVRRKLKNWLNVRVYLDGAEIVSKKVIGGQFRNWVLGPRPKLCVGVNPRWRDRVFPGVVDRVRVSRTGELPKPSWLFSQTRDQYKRKNEH